VLNGVSLVRRRRIWYNKSKSKLYYDRQSVGQPVLVPSTHLGHTTRFLLLSDSFGFVDVGRSLSRENGSAVYNCCWPSPAQSFSGPSLAGLVAIFYCLRFETPPAWRARSPYLYLLGTGWPSYTPSTGFPIRPLSGVTDSCKCCVFLIEEETLSSQRKLWPVYSYENLS
jgi:hypothetical protein